MARPPPERQASEADLLAPGGIRDEGKEEAGACFVRVVDSFWGEEVNTEVLAVGARPRQKGGDVREQSSVDGGEIG